MSAQHRPSYLPGVVTLAVLVVLTWLEFQVDGELIVLLALIGLAKAAIILQMFMHLSRLLSSDR